MMLALFAVGVGVGSIVAERLLHGEVSARFVPIAAAAMAFFAWDPRRQRWSPVSPRTGDCLDLPGLSGKLAHPRRPPRRRDGGRPLYRAALRDPAARERAGASRAA